MERAERRRRRSPGDGDGGDAAEGEVFWLAVVGGRTKTTCRLLFKVEVEPLEARHERTGGDGNGTTAAAGGRPLRGGSAA